MRHTFQYVYKTNGVQNVIRTGTLLKTKRAILQYALQFFKTSVMVN